jgi:myo-inositol-1(or 4)-monophosphatase
MADKQLLHLVIGGELKSLNGPPEFRDLSKVDLVGAFSNYQDAVRTWRSKAQETVDNAHMRYFVIHAHRLLDPDTDGEDHEH